MAEGRRSSPADANDRRLPAAGCRPPLVELESTPRSGADERRSDSSLSGRINLSAPLVCLSVCLLSCDGRPLNMSSASETGDLQSLAAGARLSRPAAANGACRISFPAPGEWRDLARHRLVVRRELCASSSRNNNNNMGAAHSLDSPHSVEPERGAAANFYQSFLQQLPADERAQHERGAIISSCGRALASRTRPSFQWLH